MTSIIIINQLKKKLEHKEAQLSEATPGSVKKLIKNEVAQLKKELKRRKKDDIKLTKKTSLLVSIWNQSMEKSGVKRENYFGQKLNGNNSYKFLNNHAKIFKNFLEAVKKYYPIFPLEDRCKKYEDLFSAYLDVFQRVNHSRPVTPEDCDKADESIEIYSKKVESFGWRTVPNKVE